MTPLTQPATHTLTPKVLAQLREVSILASLSEERMSCLEGAAHVHLETDHILVNQGEIVRTFCILLEGSLRVSNTMASGHEQTVYILEKGSAFGEVPLLANIPSTATIRALEPCEMLQLDEEQFWNLMTQCPEVRKAILGNMAMRLAKIQSTTFQQEKMASLGTLAAGLMHELNNPGAAARRASSQLRENMLRLHSLAARFTRISLTDQQKDCILDLQLYALNTIPDVVLSSIEQSEAEEALMQWMEDANIEDAWKLAPTLVSIGIDSNTLMCARSSFDDQTFSDALNWLEALVSSMQLVTTIEESITRVTDLVAAVKSYAYEGKGQKQSIDVKKSIHATLVILAHKIREKQLTLEKEFSPNLPLLSIECQNLNQVWTNLLDNAIDAAPPAGRIRLRTWTETVDAAGTPRTDVCILIEDSGPGIPAECQAHIFDPFFTTKPVGVGTGLGLGIVYRIVEQCGGSIHFTSVPGQTEFVVRLPAATPANTPAAGQPTAPPVAVPASTV
jgi:signal transduction histidine kinase